jgi:ABC-2 type transport system ATP-binding protein
MQVEAPPIPISVDNVGIEFAINRRARMRVRDFFIHGKSARPEGKFWGLRNVSLEVDRGESLAIVGGNGSGKSTLLKLIAGVLLPDEGSVTLGGRVAPLIELGAGFHPDLSARKNVYLSGVIHGLTEQQIDERFDEIVDFAEIRRFLDTPLRHFSSGMKVRLGFAIITQLPHEILLIDEVLAVGDKGFKVKSLEVVNQMFESGRTIVLVSHREEDVLEFCNRAVYMKQGRMVFDGTPEEALEAYNADVERKA